MNSFPQNYNGELVNLTCYLAYSQYTSNGTSYRGTRWDGPYAYAASGSIALGANGNIYLSGTTCAKFASMAFSTFCGGQQIKIGRVDSLYGNILWVNNYFTGYEVNLNFTLDPFGDIYATGGTQTALSLTCSPPSQSGCSRTPTGNFFAKIDKDGNKLWYKTTTSLMASVKAVSNGANLYAVGTTSGSPFDGTTVSNSSIFITKFDSTTGNKLWTNVDTSSGSAGVTANDVTIDGYGRLFVAASASSATQATTLAGQKGSIFLVQYDSVTGNSVWASSDTIASPGSLDIVNYSYISISVPTAGTGTAPLSKVCATGITTKSIDNQTKLTFGTNTDYFIKCFNILY